MYWYCERAGPAADAKVLHRLEEERRAGDRARAWAQTGHHLRRPLTFFAVTGRLEGDEHVGRVGRPAAAAGEGDHAVHVGVLADGVGELLTSCAIAWAEVVWSALI